MVLKPPLKQSPAVGTFQCLTHGAALKHWWSFLGSAHCHHAGTVVERSRDISGIQGWRRQPQGNRCSMGTQEGSSLLILLPTTLH